MENLEKWSLFPLRSSRKYLSGSARRDTMRMTCIFKNEDYSNNRELKEAAWFSYSLSVDDSNYLILWWSSDHENMKKERPCKNQVRQRILDYETDTRVWFCQGVGGLCEQPLIVRNCGVTWLLWPLYAEPPASQHKAPTVENIIRMVVAALVLVTLLILLLEAWHSNRAEKHVNRR